MALYAVYESPNPPEALLERAEKLVFVRDGFAWLAMLFPYFWLLYYRMWLEFVVFLGVVAGLGLVTNAAELSEPVSLLVSLALSLFIGLEANGLRRGSLLRKGYVEVGLAQGRNREEAELRFFHGWLPAEERRAAAGQAGSRRTGGHVTGAGGGERTVSRPDGEEIIGSFPAA